MADTSKDKRTTQALATLLPSGGIGLSMALAAADAAAATSASDASWERKSVAARLEEIRGTMSEAVKEAIQNSDPYVAVDPEARLAWWGNGWRNGGWHNGGWHNGGWGNGWHNGGWNNWGNGWHNGGWGNWGNGGLIGGLLSPLLGSPWGNGWRNW